MIIHIVKQGESLYSIAQEYDVSLRNLISINGFTPPYKLVPGQAVVVLVPRKTHEVKPGETLSSIARLYNTTTTALMQNNPWLGGGQAIAPGQVLVINYYGRKLDEIAVTGAAYPEISESTLKRTLPYLTYLGLHSYNVTEDGGLVPPAFDEEKMVSTAGEYSAAISMVISAMDSQGGYDEELIRKILEDPKVQENLIRNILDTLRRKGYRSVFLDLDFELPEDRVKYVQFVEQLTSELNLFGYPVITRLNPSSNPEEDLAYYEQLGNASNAVILATNIGGKKEGPPMAISPINEVKAVLDYAVKAIPAEKIFLGLPNYALDWPLPYVQGQTVAKEITNQEALNLALKHGANILFDEETMAPYFNYRDDEGVRHVVWFEDARSINEKLRLLQEYGLRGVSVWTVLDLYQQGWSSLSALFDIEKVY